MKGPDLVEKMKKQLDQERLSRRRGQDHRRRAVARRQARHGDLPKAQARALDIMQVPLQQAEGARGA